ncbi:MAG: glycogen/starch/alpha-glucan family phosphorylase, partial [Lachnospiraceae bacterium]|nr:glycogen/starch/alpha-glucan family phosphorylase [Lachnospiraceae bacterium]
AGLADGVDDPVWEISGQAEGADDIRDDTEMDWVERTEKTYTVMLAGKEYSARLYRLAVIGYHAEAENMADVSGTMSSEESSALKTSGFGDDRTSAVSGAHWAVTNYLNLFDLDTIDESIIEEGIFFDKTKIDQNLTLFLYPDDADEAGQLLRIYQQYLMVSAGAQLILEECAERGSDYHDLAKYAAIQINDTHPSMVIPELIRLLQEKGIAFEETVQIVTDTCAYTNHTILAEALEKWPRRYLDEVVPQLMPIIEKLDQLARDLTEDKSTWIIDENGLVHMAHMDIHFSHSTNGVAALHTKILKDTELANFYRIYPEKFNNRTNGITFRRWLLKCNPLLSAQIEHLIGPGFKTNADELEKLMSFTGEDVVLNKLFLIKKDNKKALSDWLYHTQGVTVNPDAMFLIQSKRLHEYKRQQLNLLFLIHQYFEIKAGHTPAIPIVSIFGAKAAPAYVIAQDIIHALLTLSKVIADDPEVSRWMQIVFVENYNVTAAEKMIPACDLSEQISLASKEASGTGNMKFMLNGALTLGTMDGANVEIAERVGDENIYIFGQTSEQVIRTYAAAEAAHRYRQQQGGGNGTDNGNGNGNGTKAAGDAAPGVYIAREWYQGDPNIRRAIDFLTSEQMLAAGHEENLSRLQNELIGKDWFQTLPDFNAYVVRKTQAMQDYATDPRRWTQRALINIAKAGYFSSDRTIREYNDEIWHLGE